MVVVVIFVVGTFLQTPQNRQIDGFCKPQKASNRRCFRDFSHSRKKKHRKYRCFWLRANAKPRYLRGFEPLRAKITVYYSVLWPGPSKNTGIYTVSCMLSEAFFGCQRHKNIVNYTIFTRGQSVPKNYETLTKNRPKNAQQGPPKRICKFYPLFSHPEPPKTWKPQQAEGFQGRVGGTGAPPGS